MADCLVEIDQKDWPRLRDLYTQNGKNNYIAYTTIINYIKWFEKDPNIKHIKFLCLNGDFSDGTFVVTDRCEAYADTIDEDHNRLFRLLQLIDYSKGYSFWSIRTPVHSTIQRALEENNIEIVDDNSCLFYYLPKEEALKFDTIPPEGIEIRPMTNAIDLKKANRSKDWMHRSANSFCFLERIAKYNPSIGAFKSNGTLVSWIFRLQTGLLSTLQTDDEHLYLGYASLVTKCISKKIAEQGHDIYARITPENIPSRSLFSKLGFKEMKTNGDAHLITTKITWNESDE